MIIDIETIIAIVLALAIGGGLYYIYNRFKAEKINKVFYIIKQLYDQYGDVIKEDNPALAEECKRALDTMSKAMEDGEISILEAIDITKTFVPLMGRLVKFIKTKYKS